MDNLVDFLKYLLTPAGTGVAVYFAVNKLPYVKAWFNSLLSDTKRSVVFLLSLAVPLVGMGVGMYFGYFPVNEDTVYTALKVGIEAFAASTLLHGVVDLRAKVRG